MSATLPTSREEPLRILQFNSLLTGGGTDDQCVKLALALHQLGQHCWIAGPDGRDFSKVIQARGIPFHITPAEGLLKFRLILAAAKFIKRERIQILHGHHGRDIWPTVMAAKLSGMRPKIFLTRHLAKSPGSAASKRFLLGQCDRLIAVSEFTRHVLVEGDYEPEAIEAERRVRPPMRGDFSKIEVIAGGIDTERFRPMEAETQRREWGLGPEHYAFAVAGGYDLPRGKGQREYLQAAASIAKEFPLARFLIIGRGSMREILLADIARLGLAGKAFLTPYCHDMPTAMNAIDCLVHTQVGTEAYGLVVLEAFVCGRPVIATALDGIPEAFAVGGYGELIASESVEAQVAALRRWAMRPGLKMPEREQLHQKIAKEHSITAFGKRMLASYRAELARP